MNNALISSETKIQYLENIVNAITSNIAFIEFTPDGHISDANVQFQDATEYKIDELRGKHHKIFCDQAYLSSKEYTEFWRTLQSGKTLRGTFEHIKKSGTTLWLEATYFPIIENGCVTKVLKLANDVTQQKNSLDILFHVNEAVKRSMAVIEFTPEGKIITANQNFLNLSGYQLNEIIGQHHRIFLH